MIHVGHVWKVYIDELAFKFGSFTLWIWIAFERKRRRTVYV